MRKSVIAAAFAIALIGVTMATAGLAHAMPSVNDTRSCGTLPIGIFWHVRATPNVGCRGAKRVGRAYFRKYPDCGKGVRGHCKVRHYRCIWGRGGTHVHFRKPGRLIFLRSYE